MSGSKWSSVCRSVEKFVSNLSYDDLVAGMVFNSQVSLLVDLDPSDELYRNHRQPVERLYRDHNIQRREKPPGAEGDPCYCQLIWLKEKHYFFYNNSTYLIEKARLKILIYYYVI